MRGKLDIRAFGNLLRVTRAEGTLLEARGFMVPYEKAQDSLAAVSGDHEVRNEFRTGVVVARMDLEHGLLVK